MIRTCPVKCRRRLGFKRFRAERNSISCKKACPRPFPPKHVISAGKNRSLYWQNWSRLTFQINHEDSLYRRVRLRRGPLRNRRRAEHDEMSLPRLSAGDRRSICACPRGSAGGFSADARSTALSFHPQYDDGKTQTRFLSRVRLAHHWRGKRNGRCAVDWSVGRQPRRSELVQAADG